MGGNKCRDGLKRLLRKREIFVLKGKIRCVSFRKCNALDHSSGSRHWSRQNGWVKIWIKLFLSMPVGIYRPLANHPEMVTMISWQSIFPYYYIHFKNARFFDIDKISDKMVQFILISLERLLYHFGCFIDNITAYAPVSPGIQGSYAVHGNNQARSCRCLWFTRHLFISSSLVDVQGRSILTHKYVI